MGACNIDFVIKGKVSDREVERAFKNQKLEDAETNGLSDGYSGDFQTVEDVITDYLGDVFETHEEAQKFCLDKAQKWEYVVAVYYKTAKGEINTLVCGWGAC